MIEFIFGVCIGVVIGGLIFDRAGLKDRVSETIGSIRDRLPEREQVGNFFTGVGAWITGHLIVSVVVGIVVVTGIVLLVAQQPPAKPLIKVGSIVALNDSCGNSKNVTITVEDVSRGNIVVGAITDNGDCRKTYRLGAPPPSSVNNSVTPNQGVGVTGQ